MARRRRALALDAELRQEQHQRLLWLAQRRHEVAAKVAAAAAATEAAAALAARMAAPPQEQELAQEREQEQQQQQQQEPEPEPAAEMVAPEHMLGVAAVLERMAQVVAAAKAAPASPAPMVMKRSLPPSPAADE
eukprot:COSAG01_NODE_25246_length_751_cov_0.975460_1_plen_133_part_10